MCPADGEQTAGDAAGERAGRGPWDIPCPVCGGPLEMQATPERVSNPQNAYGMSKFGRGDGGGQPGTPVRHPDRRAALQHRAGTAAVGVQRLLRRLPDLLPELPARQRAGAVRGRRRHPRLRQHRRRGGRQRAGARPTSALPGGCSTSAAAAGTPPGSSPRSSVRQYGSDQPAAVTGEYRFGDTRHIFSDIGALRALGWEPRRTPADRSPRTPSGSRAWTGWTGCWPRPTRRCAPLGVVRKAGGVKAFLLAAGLGSRLRPITDTMPEVHARPSAVGRCSTSGSTRWTGPASTRCWSTCTTCRTWCRPPRRTRPGRPRCGTFYEPELLGSAGTLAANRRLGARRGDVPGLQRRQPHRLRPAGR